MAYNPYPDYNSAEWKKIWRGNHMFCTGPRGLYVNGDPEDMLVVHQLPDGGEEARRSSQTMARLILGCRALEPSDVWHLRRHWAGLHNLHR